MKNTTVKNIVIAVIITAACLGMVWLIAGKENMPEGTLALYYRTDCPHCKNVEKFIEDNAIRDKFTIEKKEVGENGQNNNELIVRAQLCSIDISTVGVPFLYDHGECFMGEEEIIDYFRKKL